ncbi:palmitoyltransferase ZDHHC21-like isoform X4 [Saccostrea cucullata]|uniref:palmitoyltransferase ZDHHC21-like isoform X4 n=1 Tax=Saccostrea cuccullata TaxID=36930 RepID=UPI002ED55200
MYEGEVMASPATVVSGLGLGKPAPTSEYSSNIIVKKFPLLGRLHFVKDKNGIMCLAFTFFYWVYGTWCGLWVVLLPHMRDGQASEPFVALYVLCSVMCVCSLFRASTLNPGRVPLISDADNIDTSEWEMCEKCQRKRPKRAHHCRRCQQCVLRMDHHCPWINNCVGEENHYAFMQLLFWAFCLSWMAFWALMLHYWYYPACITCDKSVFYIKHSIWFKYLLVLMSLSMGLFMGAGLQDQLQNLNRESFQFRHEAWFTYILTALAVFMGIIMGGQLVGQHFMLLVDRTTLENMKDPYPDIESIKIRSEWAAYHEMCGGGSMIFWLLPCRSRRGIRPSYFYSNPV